MGGKIIYYELNKKINLLKNFATGEAFFLCRNSIDLLKIQIKFDKMFQNIPHL